MSHIFEIRKIKTKNISMPEKSWTHIIRKHPQIASYQEEIKETLSKPDTIINQHREDEDVRYYYKHRESKNKFLLIIIKYKNGTGFIISVHFVRNIK